MASSWTAVQVAVGTRVEARVDVEFGSQDAEDTFLNVINGSGIKKGRLVIVSMEKDGQFKGKMIKALDDEKSHTNMVVGTLNRTKPNEETKHMDENLPIIKEDAYEPDDSMSVTLKLEQSHARDHDNASGQVESVKFSHTSSTMTISQSPQMRRLAKQHHSASNQIDMLEEITDHSTYSSSPDNLSVNPISQLSSLSSHVQNKPLYHSSSISTGVCDEQSPSITSQDGNKKALAISSSPQKYHDEAIKKNHHTVNCVLHGIESSLGKFYDRLEECESFYDKKFANQFEEFLSRNEETCSINKVSNALYLHCIEYHLKSKKCESFCSRLWKFCTVNKICNVLQYANEGLLIFSEFRKDQIGTICYEYVGLKENFKQVGKGGFGKVYAYVQPDIQRKLAVKVEEKRPLAGCSTELFKKIINLNHPNVIKMIEYLTGPVDKDENRLCLFVMPLMNQRDLGRQFKKSCLCILDYMECYPNIKNYIFRNYLVLFCQVFEGLRYLQTQHIVHRDIKPSNILVHQKCKCKNTMLCQCPEAIAEYVVSDLDLLCFEGVSSGTKFEEWKMTQHDPAGTIEMKPLEAFYSSGKGELVINHRSDIWSGSVTMMNILVGKRTKWEPHDQIKKFLSFLTGTIRTVTTGIANSCNMLDSLTKKYDNPSATSESKEEINKIFAGVKPLRKLLKESNENLKKVQSFQGGVPEVYKEDSPLAGILSTVYIANGLHWVCLSKLPDIYKTTLWNCMKKTLDHITEGVKFFPENRQDAGKFVDNLKPLQKLAMDEVV